MERLPPNARQLLAQYGLAAKKSWGQNFLTDQSILERIAAATDTGAPQVTVELGAGLGALTYHLLQRDGTVIAVERDRDLTPILEKTFAWAPDFRVVEANAARLDYAELAAAEGGPVVVAGNLPYQLSSRILVSVADASRAVSRAVFLVQREVAERLVAEPGSKIYGLLSVLVQRSLATEMLEVVPPTAFEPRPKVHSAVVRLISDGRQRPASEDKRLVMVARAGFSARRKMLRNALSTALKLESEAVVAAMEKVGLDPTVRAERLDHHAYANLAEAMHQAGLLPGDGEAL